MLPAFVIGLREGLETVVILGTIALFLIHQGRRDELRLVWIASAAASGLCVVIAVTLWLVEISLSPIAEERFEAVVGVAAVATVTFMVIWMRRFPKDLVRDSNATAARELARGSGKALAGLAFFAVLREGFEVSVFVLALVGAKASNPLSGTAGALAGVLVAVVVGDRGGAGRRAPRHRPVLPGDRLHPRTQRGRPGHDRRPRRQRLGLARLRPDPQFNWSEVAPPGTVLSSVVTGMFGIQPYPVLIEVVVWLAYLIPMLLVVVLPRRTSAATSSRARSRTRRLMVLGTVGAAFAVALTASVLLTRLSAVSAAPAGRVGAAVYGTSRSGPERADRFCCFAAPRRTATTGASTVVAANDPDGPRAMTPLSCDRVDFEGGMGLCLTRPTSGLLVTTTAIVFNSHFKKVHTRRRSPGSRAGPGSRPTAATAPSPPSSPGTPTPRSATTPPAPTSSTCGPAWCCSTSTSSPSPATASPSRRPTSTSGA